MGRRKASRKASKEPNNGEGTKMAKALFAEVMEGSVNTYVDPRSCLPLTRIRHTSKSGVMRLKRLFSGADGKTRSGTSVGCSVGFVAGSDMPILIPLQGDLERYIIEYFCDEKEMSDRDAREEAKGRAIWYGVVDGVHRLMALLDLIREYPESWDGFQWPVTMLNGGHSLQVLRQLARQQNRKLTENHYIETTLFDQLSGLKKEAERLTGERGKKPTSSQVVDAYDGSGELMDTTMQQMASTAMRLSEKVISVLGAVMNAEHPELVKVPHVRGSLDDERNQAEVMSTVDCRVFRRFLNITSIKQATVFMRATGEEEVQAQVNTLYRCRDICRTSGFKSIPYKVVVEQYSKATLAAKECRKFEALMETDKWPVAMETMRKNMLETQKFDEAVSRNAGNDNDVLEDLIEQYTLVCPDVASAKIQKYRALNQSPEEVAAKEKDAARSGSKVGPQDSEFIPGSSSSVRNKGSEREKAGLAPHSEKLNVDNRRDSNETEDDLLAIVPRKGEKRTPKTQASEHLDLRGHVRVSRGSNRDNVELLESLHVKCHQMKWQDFDRNILSQEDSVFDLVLTDPSHGVRSNATVSGTNDKNYVDDREMKDFSMFCKRVLVPGGYIFLFTPANCFYRWSEAFREADFKVCEYPFILNKNTSGLQRTRLEDFPQCAAELSVMARAPGKTARSFKLDFESPFSIFECSQKRCFASILNAPLPKQKLTNGKSKAPLVTQEKNPDVLAEVINTFSPVGGRVLDCYAGTLTTAIAALIASRRCVCVEMNADIYNLALPRLLKFVSSHRDKSKTVALTTSETTSTVPVPGIAKSVTKINGGCEQKAHDEPKTRESHAESNAQESHDEPKSQGSHDEPKTQESHDEPKPPSETNVIRGGTKVVLMHGGIEVGSATVQSSTGEMGGELMRKIHGQELTAWEEEGEDLVAVLCVSISPDYAHLGYIYSFPSHDETPATLGDLHRSGVYVWDRNKISSL